jgi:dolichol-phosphate mannosyltransferase
MNEPVVFPQRDKDTPSVSIVVPTYREVENLPYLVERIEQLLAQNEIALEVLIIDDDSRDGTVEQVKALDRDWIHLTVRTDERGLSSAVVHGLGLARNEIVIVMDADLSHPPETIPKMIAALEDGAEFAVGSRYVAGGSTDASWGLFRWINSKVATLLARPLTKLRDPMTGFLAARRASIEPALRRDDLNPIGYKIALELIVKCGFRRVAEIPIHFADRRHGRSKLTLGEQLRYLQHLRRLYSHRLFHRR